jgi:hypothetical protein
MSELFSIKENKNNIFYVKFYPSLNLALGCEKATLILGRLEYWFERYTSGFYKFVEPCSHPLYREGDSWSEEIGFPRKAFAKAFDLIGVRYKSKSAFMQSKDKFQGKLYASYHDRKTNQTYFIRNHEFASQFIKDLFSLKKPQSVSRGKKVTEKKAASCTTISLNVNGRSRKGKNGRSFGGTIGGKENIPIQRNTSSLKETSKNSSPPQLEPAQTEMTEEMIKIWKEEIGDLGISTISAQFLSKLFEAFKAFFDQSLESWKQYCCLISSSKFLMGEAQNKFFKKAWITWAIGEEAIEKVRGGVFKLGDRETKLDSKVQEINSTIEILDQKNKAVEESIQDIKKQCKTQRRNKVREVIASFGKKEIQGFRTDFEHHLQRENNSLTEEFKRAGWEGVFIETYFDSYMEEKMETQLFTTPLEEETSQYLKSSGLLEKVMSISNEMQRLKTLKERLKSEGKSLICALQSPVTFPN